jgi:hypothetical protein
LATATTALAQRGGKAEPLHIQFERNSTCATLKNAIRGSEEAEYLFGARAGQELNIRITSNPKDTVVPRLKDPDLRDLILKKDGSSSWTAKLTKSGEYFMSITRDGGGRGKTTYTLILSIE